MNNKEVFILILVAFISRLPQLLSPNLLLDGDEAIVGLMANHLYDGKGFPVFFYGQQYGFSLVEVAAIDVFYVFWGKTDIAVKLAMLSLWTLGIVFFYKTLKLLPFRYTYTPFLMSLVFICSPAWAVWSMKARGGYLTAFLLNFIATYLLFNPRLNTKNWTFISLGCLVALILESNALWLAGLLPLIVYQVVSTRKWIGFLWILVGILPIYVACYYLKQYNESFWQPQLLDISIANILAGFSDIPNRIFYNMTGSYYLNKTITADLITISLAHCFKILILIAPLIGLYCWIKKVFSTPFVYLFGVASYSIIAYLFVLRDHDSPRYLLPLMGAILLMYAFVVDKISYKWLYFSIFGFLISLGSCSLYQFKNFKFESHTRAQLVQLVDTLLAKEVKYAFCEPALLQWQLMFYAQEKILARYIYVRDRYTFYGEQVNEAFAMGKPTAWVGYTNHFQEYKDSTRTLFVDKQYVVFLNPDKELLRQLSFDIP